MSARMDEEGLSVLRAELLAGLSGRVVEIGCGNGMNFTHYPSTVTGVQAVEPEPHLRKLAHTATAQAPVPIDVTAGTGEALSLPDDSVDAGVLCLVLCSTPDPHATVAELLRVIRGGGTVVFLEHCVADTPGLRLVQRIADATVWPLLTGGCHTSRDPLTTIRSGGFTVDTVRRLRYPERPTVPASPHVLGSASCP
ncbi:MAG: class I SAM-dependent methyltransferase [Nocardioidaceae bacterium]